MTDSQLRRLNFIKPQFMYIGLISDTHGVFDAPFKEFLAPVDEIWHAGDFGGGLDLAAAISEFKPLVGVAGNCDNYDLRFTHPLHRFFECEGMKVLMTHIGGYPGNYDASIRSTLRTNPPTLFISGHSHILKVMHDRHINTLHISPGAAGIHGFHKVRTLVRFTVNGAKFEDMEVIELSD